jgi:DNA-binding CsgD family transcriptional regulator
VIGTVGDTKIGTPRRTPDAGRTQFVPRQRVPSLVDRPGRPGVSGAGAGGGMVALLADPLKDSRERLAAALTAAGATRVVQADTVGAVEELIADAPGGHLALVSLGFGSATPRLIGGLAQVPWSRVIALALSPDPAPLLHALAAGATGVLRGHPGRIDPGLPDRLGRLTPRELEVLKLVADGRSNKWIAEELSLSALTVKSHLSRISRKLGTGERSHQVAVAMRAGVLR